MEWKIFTTIFIAVFIAEPGDKYLEIFGVRVKTLILL